MRPLLRRMQNPPSLQRLREPPPINSQTLQAHARRGQMRRMPSPKRTKLGKRRMGQKLQDCQVPKREGAELLLRMRKLRDMRKIREVGFHLRQNRSQSKRKPSHDQGGQSRRMAQARRRTVDVPKLQPTHILRP